MSHVLVSTPACKDGDRGASAQSRSRPVIVYRARRKMCRHLARMCRIELVSTPGRSDAELAHERRMWMSAASRAWRKSVAHVAVAEVPCPVVGTVLLLIVVSLHVLYM